MIQDPKNPSVLEAQEFDAACPGGKAHYIVFYKQGQDPRAGHWVLERTSDGAVVEQGSLRIMLELMTRYPYSRRATWAEDTLRYRPAIFDLPFTYGGKEVPPLHMHKTYPLRGGPEQRPRSEEEERGIWQDVMSKIKTDYREVEQRVLDANPGIDKKWPY
jgi:hypothetical protein